MDNHLHPRDALGASVEEVAEWLSIQEGRHVSVAEVRRIEAQALRKMRQKFRERGLTPDNLLPDR